MNAILKFYHLALAGLLIVAIPSVSAQTTNCIPENTFITDDGRVFWYQHGQRLIDVSKIEQAKQSQESVPAEQDPQGNWGEQANGFQLSLRFEKQVFTNGEDIVGTILIRNIATNAQTYFRPAYIAAMKDGKPVKRLNDVKIKELTVSPETTLFPQSQHKSKEHLNQEYNLLETGKYEFQAACSRPQVTSKTVTIIVTNTP